MKEEVLESKGHHPHIERIERQPVHFDQRSRVAISVEEFERVMNERKKISSGLTNSEVVGDITIEEDLAQDVDL